MLHHSSPLSVPLLPSSCPGSLSHSSVIFLQGSRVPRLEVRGEVQAGGMGVCRTEAHRVATFRAEEGHRSEHR